MKCEKCGKEVPMLINGTCDECGLSVDFLNKKLNIKTREEKPTVRQVIKLFAPKQRIRIVAGEYSIAGTAESIFELIEARWLDERTEKADVVLGEILEIKVREE